MKNNDTVSLQDIYENHLSTINNINFTYREIEVIACLLRGKKSKNIAKFLSSKPKTKEITSRTVDTHIDRIKLKLGCDRENIIDIIEKFHRRSILEEVYIRLNNEFFFSKVWKVFHNWKRKTFLLT